jgi:hypothetical protein
MAHIDPLYVPGDLVLATLVIPDDLQPAPRPDIPPEWKQ